MSNPHGHHVQPRRLTKGPKHHFFGYYGKRQFGPDDRLVLGLECELGGRLQQPGDRAVLGFVDTERDHAWTPLAEIAAWNWQMGCQAEWLPGNKPRLVYNNIDGNKTVGIFRDLATGEARTLPLPVCTLAPDGRTALTLNFARLWQVRPETGYCGAADPWAGQAAPDGDGISRLDLATGEAKLLVSHAHLAEYRRGGDPAADAQWYFTHPLFNEDGSRFMFWYRSFPSWRSYVFTANPDGGALHLVNDRNSHCTWLGRDRILAWAARPETGTHTYLFDDQSDRWEILGPGQLEFNGHATYAPDRRWLITDKEPDGRCERTLVLYDCAANRRFDLARLHSPPSQTGPLRCDLHPRWNRAGNQVCVDSLHDGTRQMYLFDLRGILAPETAAGNG